MPLLAPAETPPILCTYSFFVTTLMTTTYSAWGKLFKKHQTNVTENTISPHAFFELFFAIQCSAISTLIYDGRVAVAHMIMLNAIKSNRHTANMPFHAP